MEEVKPFPILLIFQNINTITHQHINTTSTMKKLITITAALLAIAAVIFVGKYKAERDANAVFVTGEAKPQFAKVLLVDKRQPRQNITFIMGKDKDADNPYYKAAENYYRYHPEAKTEWLITHLHSLKEVRDYLDKHAKGKWGAINLVVHSNEWTGIGVKVVRDGQRATVQSIQDALNAGHFPPLPESVIDADTELLVHACALGKNEKLLEAISLAFGGEAAGSPLVRSSKYFIHYNSPDGSPRNTERYLSEFWYAYFKTGYRPSDTQLVRELNNENPEAEVKFRDALTRTQPRFPGDAYHYYFNVPVNWTVTFPTEANRPDLNTQAAKDTFLNHQTELLDMVNKLDIPLDKFRWQFEKTTYTFEDGTTEPAILIKGKSSVLCVLKSLTKPNPGNPKLPLPLEPPVEDGRFYTAI